MTEPTPIEVRLPAHLTELVRSLGRPKTARESVVFGLVGDAKLGKARVLLVQDVLGLDERDYMKSTLHGAQWRGRAMLPILNQALARNLGVIILHCHPHTGPVALSSDDRRSAEQLLPIFQNIIPDRSHASVVFGFSHVAGVALLPQEAEFREIHLVRWLGRVILDHPHEDFHTGRSEEIFDRQLPLIGEQGQQRLKRSHVAVVGLCGGGGHVVQQLAHMGLGHITGIDPDYVDKSNCSRMVGSTRMDAVLSRRKVDVAARMVRRISRKAKFSGIPYAVPHELAVQALKAADIIIGCVDNVRARRDIQDLSWRYLIPYIDIGLIIKPGPHRKDLIISGNVATLIPGHFCLRCWGLLDGIEPQPGYVHGSAAREAQVISFNGVLASQAVSEALQLLTGFAEPETEMAIKKFDGVDGTVQKMIVKKRADCTLCSSVLGSGDAVFRRI